MTGAGLKKCSPRTRSGRVVAAAMAATDSALVLVARMVVGGAAASSARKIARLASRSSSAASTTSSAAGRDVVERWRVAQALEAAVDPVVGRVRVEVERGRRAARGPLRIALVTALDRGGVHVVERDPVAGLERELGDPGAHRPGPDDADRSRSRPSSDRLDRFERLAAVAAVNGCVRHWVGPKTLSRTVRREPQCGHGTRGSRSIRVRPAVGGPGGAIPAASSAARPGRR